MSPARLGPPGTAATDIECPPWTCLVRLRVHLELPRVQGCVPQCALEEAVVCGQAHASQSGSPALLGSQSGSAKRPMSAIGKLELRSSFHLVADAGHRMLIQTILSFVRGQGWRRGVRQAISATQHRARASGLNRVCAFAIAPLVSVSHVFCRLWRVTAEARPFACSQIGCKDSATESHTRHRGRDHTWIWLA